MSALTSERATDQAIARAIPHLDHPHTDATWEEVSAMRDLAITCRVWQTPLNPSDVLRVSDSIDAIARALRWERHDNTMALAGVR